MLVLAEDDGDGDVADEHPRRSGQHDGFAAQFVDVQDRWDGR